MNTFEKDSLPKAWSQASKGVVNNILLQEISDYHLYAKNPDTGENFRRFYRHLEPLHCFLAVNVAKDFFAQHDSRISIQKRINSYAEGLRLHSFFAKCKKVAVLKGTIDLAHGDVLKKQIKNLSSAEKKSVGVVFLDYSGFEKLGIDEALFKSINCLFLGGIKSLKDRYMLLAHGISGETGAVRSKEIIWWGIPFGMIFVFNLSKLLASRNIEIVPAINSPGDQVFSRSLLTVKHHFSFSSKYVDKVYTSTPLVQGFEEIYRPKLVQFNPSFYGTSELEGVSNVLSNAEVKLLNRLEKLKYSGSLLISSVSRVDKTSSQKYLTFVDNLLDRVSRACLLCFGKKLPSEYQDLVQKYGKNRIIFVGWLSPNATVKIIGILDLFIDPFPFGAGMTFASAAFQEIPIVSTSDYVSTSPSSISILYYYYKTGAIKFKSREVVSNLFGPVSSFLERAVACLNSEAHGGAADLKHIVSTILMDSSTSVLSSQKS